ncbi:MAG: amidohydrolase family protein [Acidobacteria bacterium]|nr:amidohydrolase family protein [Acidobacteriota bacterium]
MPLRILSAEWVVPVAAPPFRGGGVLVDGEQIIGVGPAPELLRSAPGTAITDLGHAALMPGFVNLHAHLELTAMRGYLEEPRFMPWLMRVVSGRRRLGEEDLRASALAGAVESVRAGITTIADIGQSNHGFHAMSQVGVRGVFFQEIVCLQAEDVDQVFHEFEGRIAPLLDRQSKRLGVGVSPHSPCTVRPEMFERLMTWWRASPRPVTIHTAESIAELEWLKNGTGDFASLLGGTDFPPDPPGCSPIAYLDRLGLLEAGPLLAHAIHTDRHDIELIARHHCAVAHCPKSNAKLGQGIMPLQAFQAAGITVGLGTDSAGSNNVLDIIDEARFCGLIHRASNRNAALLPAGELLRMATIEGARALGWQDRIGTLEPGKQADLIAIDLSRIGLQPIHDVEAAVVFASAAGDVKFVMVQGEPLFKAGRMTSVSEQETALGLVKAGMRLDESTASAPEP